MQDYLPLPIGTRTDEMAFEVYSAVYEAWQKYRDKGIPAKERHMAESFIKRLYGAAKLAGKGPKTGGLKDLVNFIYDEMIPLAQVALEEYRDNYRDIVEGEEKSSISQRRSQARDAAIEVILERLMPESRTDRNREKNREAYRETIKRLWTKDGKWLNRRSDGLAKDLTAMELGIKSNSVHVLRHRARQKSRN